MLNTGEVSDPWEKVHAIDLSSSTSDEEIQELQAQHGTDLTKFQTHVLAGTVPETWEFDQSYWELNILFYSYDAGL